MTKLNAKQAAEFLGIAVKTLRMWRWNHRYLLPYSKVNNRAYYKLEDLEAFKANKEAFKRPPRSEIARELYRHIPEVPL